MLLLKVENLRVRYDGAEEDTLKGVSLEIGAGERLALVGESGSGKSTLARALLGLCPVTGGVSVGSCVCRRSNRSGIRGIAEPSR